MASPNSKATLKEYCLRQLGKPVIEINVDDDQVDDLLDDTIQLFAEIAPSQTTMNLHQVRDNANWLAFNSSIKLSTCDCVFPLFGSTRYAAQYIAKMPSMILPSFIAAITFLII